MTIEKLLTTNVNEHTEKKANLTYLSWAWAWAEALKADPAASYTVHMFDECGQNGAKRTVPYMSINDTAMVMVTATMFGKPMTCQLPVMDHRNKAIVNPDAFAVNTAIMRCMTKALSLHGLGLYIYAGEDLPEQDTSVIDAVVAAIKERHQAGDEAGMYGEWESIADNEVRMKVWENLKFDSKVRSAIKAYKEKLNSKE